MKTTATTTTTRTTKYDYPEGFTAEQKKAFRRNMRKSTKAGLAAQAKLEELINSEPPTIQFSFTEDPASLEAYDFLDSLIRPSDL